MPEPTATIAPTVAYNRRTLYETLDEVMRLLAELMYVDRTLQYIDERDFAVHGSLPGGAPGVTPYQIQIGATFPFVRELRVPDDYASDQNQFDAIMADISNIAWEASRWAETDLASLTIRIAPITHPSAGIYEYNIIRPLESATWTLQDDVVNDFDGLEYSLGEWEGEAADNFATAFYRPFQDTQVSHEHLFGALVGGLVTAKAITESTQHSLMNAVHYTREVVMEQLELRSQQAARVSSRTMLILSAGLSVLAAALGNHRLWPVVVETAAGALAIAANGIPDQAATEHILQGQTAEQLSDALDHAIRQIEDNADAQSNELKRELDAVLDRVERLRAGPDGEDGRLIPVQPDLVDGVDSGTFRHESSESGVIGS